MRRFYNAYLALMCFIFCLSAPSIHAAHRDSLKAEQLMIEGCRLEKENKSAEAIKMLRASAALFASFNSWESYIKNQNIICRIYWRTGETDLALKHANLALQECRLQLGIGKSLQEVVILENIGIIYGIKGYSHLSSKYFENCLRLRKELSGAKDPALCKIMNNIGVEQYKQGHYDKALSFLFDAVQLKEELHGKNHRSLISSYNMISLIYIKKSAFKKGYKFAGKSLKITQAAYGEQHPKTADAYQRLGKAYHYFGAHRKALEYLQQSLKINQQVLGSNHLYQASTHNNIGEALLSINKYSEALLHFQKALEIIKKNKAQKSHQAIAIYNNIGATYHHKKDPFTALKYYYFALQSHTALTGYKHPNVAKIYNLIGQQYTEMQARHQALEAYQLALTANLIHYHNKGVHHCPKWSEQLEYGEATALISSLLAKGQIAFQLYQQNQDLRFLKDAYQALKLALKVVEATELSYSNHKDKLTILEKEQAIYRLAIELCLAQYSQHQEEKYLKEAFDISERNKSVLLKEQLQKNMALRIGGVAKQLIEQEKKLRIDIAEQQKRLRDAQKINDKGLVEACENKLFEMSVEQKKLTQQIKQKYPQYFQLLKMQNSGFIELFQEKILDDETVLLEYFVSDSSVHLFVLSKDQFQLTTTPVKELNMTIKQFRKLLVKLRPDKQLFQKDLKNFTRTSHQLYQHLIAPAKLHKNIKRLIIVADGVLNNIPFELLLENRPREEVTSYKKLPYLIKSYAIRYSYSANLLYANNKQSQSALKQEILAFAPKYDYQTDAVLAAEHSKELSEMRSVLMDLPGARKEVRQLEQYFSGSFNYNEDANEALFKSKAEEYGILHLAMHGKLSKNDPNNSGLVFSERGKSEEDHILYSYEISNMNLQASLIVLSACETGYGQYHSGEGVMSVGRSFMYAGAQSLIMSLWTVNDKATEQLMYYFYQQLAEGKPKDIALQQAKLKYLEKSQGIASHPFLWSGFIALGDANTVVLKTKGTYWPYLLAISIFVISSTLSIWKFDASKKEKFREKFREL